jgi:hypothetical protein
MRTELGWKYPALLVVSAIVAVIGFSTSSDAAEVGRDLQARAAEAPT